EHFCVPLLTQVPDPLQVSAFCSTPAEHDDALHTVPEAHSAQAPEPLHEPLVPQVEAADAPHSLSGSVPLLMSPQVPSTPLPFLAAVHAWQVPVQAVLQHTPSTQSPLEH